MSDARVTETTDAPDDYPDDVKTVPAVRKNPPAKFGWCLTGHHEKCKRTSNDGKRTCACTSCGDRHGSEYEDMPAYMDDELARIIKTYNL